MESSQSGWWHRHGWTVAILLSAFGMAFAIRTIWTYPLIQQFGPLFSYAGGSDSYYHSRVTTYIILNHQNLVFDPLLHYPVGAYNPREPLFDWMNAILGIVFAPLFGGNAVAAGAWFLDFQGPFWAALGVFPVYLIGREVSSKRMGLIAAVIFPFLSANIDSSIFGYANYLSFYTFFILITVYSYIRTSKAVGTRRWVEDYRRPRQYLPALRAFLRTERTAVKWAVFTGVSLGALALAWQGYTYAIVVIGLSLVIAMIVERIRRVDSFGLYVTTWIVGLVGFPMAIPYYLVQHQFAAWFDLPLLLFFGVLALLLPFLLMRDIPWVFSIPALVLFVLGAAAFLYFVEPAYFVNIVTGQGYFAKTLIYSTVAEAQAPSIDELVVGYGVVTFFLAFVGVAIFIYTLARGRFKRHHIIFLVFAILSIYLPISAAKFFLLGSPVFALLPAEAIKRALDVGGYPELRRTVASLSDRRSQAAAFRKAFKARHVLVILLVLVIVLPNVWISIDASIPGNTKDQVSTQVYDTLPSFLKGNSSTENNYFGAAGTSLDTSNQYDSAGYNWLAQQDTATAAAQRPAFVSWWDYGFQAIDQGDHPSVADNFQNGIDPAGQFLLAQNESSAIAVLITTLLQGEQYASGSLNLPPALNAILAQDGLNLPQLHQLLVNQSADVPLVVNNPGRYLPVNPSTLTVDNAMYLAVSYFIATSQTLSGVAKIYDDVQAYTGWSIRYDMTDSRLIPFSGQDTGIFYAPADLTGRVLDAAGLPSTYFNVTVLGSDGNYYPLGQVPADVSSVDYYINYFSPFYNSMIYRTYFGYNGTDVGLTGIPGLEGTASASPIEPGWMLQHFEVVYKTAYYCPLPAAEASANPNCFVAMNQPQAVALAARTNTTANTSSSSYFGGGESMLEYYPGQTLYGDVQLPDGNAVPGAHVTVFDQWGIPHVTVTTAPDGSFTIVLPPGNDTLNVTTGTVQGLQQQGSVTLASVSVRVPNSVGLSLDAPSVQQVITVPAGSASGFVYWNVANTTSYTPTTDPVVPGAQIVLWGPGNLSKITTTTDASGSFELTNVPPGVYNYNVIHGGYNYTETPLTISPPPAAPTNGTVGLTVGSVNGVVHNPQGGFVSGAIVTLGGASGVVQSNTTNVSGAFQISGYPPGNYTLTAAITGTNERSVGVAVAIASPSSGLTTNLTVQPTTVVAVTVESGGVPAVGIPVQFVPIASFDNVSLSPIRALEQAGSNSSTAISGRNGIATISLPLGNYSVTALGFLGSTLYAGLSELITTSLPPTLSMVLPLSPAVRLYGTVSTGGPGANTTAVIAYAANGDPANAWASGGAYSLYLPAGTYTVLALQGPSNSTGTYYSALSSVALTAPTALNLQPSVSVAARLNVGSELPRDVFFPAVGATVTVIAGPSSGGPTVTTIASGTGRSVTFLPSAVPLPASTYCISASAPGFVSATECGITPNGLAALVDFPIALVQVPVTIRTLGIPTGTVSTVNLTALSTTAVNLTLTGGPTWNVVLPPGEYGVSGWAPTGSGKVIYLPAGVRNETVGFGATSGSLTLSLVSQTKSSGTITLPTGGVLSNVQVAFSSSAFNTTVNGTTYSKGFFAPLGSYSALATVPVGMGEFTGLERVTVASGGAISPALSLAVPGYSITGTLDQPSGALLAATTTVTLTAPSGASALVPVTDGKFSTELPGNQTYNVTASTTVLARAASGEYYQSWVQSPGAVCVVGSAATGCPITMVSTTQLVWLNGTLSAPGVPGLVAGSVRLYGPSTAPTLSTVPAANGTFSVQVLPGTYSVYATGGGGSSPLAALTTVSASLSTINPVPIVLAPTWTVAITSVPPSDLAPLLGAINVTITNAFGAQALYPGVTAYSPLALALPVGSYTVSATSFGDPYGIPANATATSTVRVVNGNVGTTLLLAYHYTERTVAAIVGAPYATVTSPGTATFAFSVQNTGNTPLVVHAVGSPAYWGFDFSFSNVTLAPVGPNSLVRASVVIQVPATIPTAHPGVVIEIELANGTVVGSFSPTVNVVPYYGVGVGPATAAPPTIGVTSALIPFYLADTGNTAETVALSVVDSSRVTSLGWTIGFRGPSGPLTGSSVDLTAFSNATYDVNLTTPLSIFVPVGTVTVQATVVNASGSVQAFATLSVPTASIHPTTSSNGTAPATVTGPSIAAPPSALPDWVIPLLSFVPAIALVVGVITIRWWRSRRWTRR
ncbi:MAG: STT3 domain-containing protein [Thermoplasmata archaeon]